MHYALELDTEAKRRAFFDAVTQGADGTDWSGQPMGLHTVPLADLQQSLDQVLADLAAKKANR